MKIMVSRGKQQLPSWYNYHIDAKSSEAATQAMRDIINQVWPNDDVVRVAVPHEYWLKLSSVVEEMTSREPEYAPGVLILRAFPSENKSHVTFRILANLSNWIEAGKGRGYASCGSTIITDQGEVRISSICWRLKKLARKQMSNSHVQRDMPGLWTEVCFSKRKDFDEAFAKIETHVPSKTTVFVAVVILQAPTDKDLERVHKSIRAPINTTSAKTHQLAAETPNEALVKFRSIVAPYVIVWELNARFHEAKYYIVDRGLHVDLLLPGVEEPLRLKMDNIIRAMV